MNKLAEGKHLISSSPKRNMAQVVYHNTDAKGAKFSLTRHEPLDASKPFKPFKRKTVKRIDGANIETKPKS